MRVAGGVGMRRVYDDGVMMRGIEWTVEWLCDDDWWVMIEEGWWWSEYDEWWGKWWWVINDEGVLICVEWGGWSDDEGVMIEGVKSDWGMSIEWWWVMSDGWGIVDECWMSNGWVIIVECGRELWWVGSDWLLRRGYCGVRRREWLLLNAAYWVTAWLWLMMVWAWVCYWSEGVMRYWCGIVLGCGSDDVVVVVGGVRRIEWGVMEWWWRSADDGFVSYYDGVIEDEGVRRDLWGWIEWGLT